MTEQCSKHVLQALPASNALYGRTDGRTNEERLSPTRYQETSVTRAPAYGISPIDEHRARQASKGATA
jgi:hypothetical protein